MVWLINEFMKSATILISSSIVIEIHSITKKQNDNNWTSNIYTIVHNTELGWIQSLIWLLHYDQYRSHQKILIFVEQGMETGGEWIITLT